MNILTSILTNILTNEQIQQTAPSAFAGQPYQHQSLKYAFVPTIDVIEGMRNAGFFPVQAMQSRTRIASKQMFTKHMLRFRSSIEPISVGDSVFETVLINSHDGTSSYELMLGVFRLVCQNGMVVSDGMVQSVRVRHVGNITDSVIEASVRLLDKSEPIRQAISQWRSILVSPAEQQLLAEAAHSLRFESGSNMAEAITPDKLLTPRRMADTGNDLWSVFNRIQENTIQGGLRGRVKLNTYQRPRRVRSQAVTGIDQNVKLNQALWTLAEKMAELKK